MHSPKRLCTSNAKQSRAGQLQGNSGRWRRAVRGTGRLLVTRQVLAQFAKQDRLATAIIPRALDVQSRGLIAGVITPGDSIVVQSLADFAPQFVDRAQQIEGDASELEILKRAKTHEAQKVIAVTRHDNVNIAIAQIAKVLFHVPTVVARVSDPQREVIYRELGIHTVCPLLLATAELVRRFTQASPEESAR